MTGLVNKAIAKFNQDELCRYEKLFNTTYSVTTHSYLKFKLKNGLRLGSSIYAGVFVLTLLKLYQ